MQHAYFEYCVYLSPQNAMCPWVIDSNYDNWNAFYSRLQYKEN